MTRLDPGTQFFNGLAKSSRAMLDRLVMDRKPMDRMTLDGTNANIEEWRKSSDPS